MQGKLNLVICIISAFFFSIPSLAQQFNRELLNPKPKKIILNFNKVNVYDTSLNYSRDTILIINDSIRATKFTKEIIFSQALFPKETDFINTQFRGVEFFDATFQNEVDFTNAEFREWVGFYNTDFRKKTEFNASLFQARPMFGEAIFRDQASFYEVKFQEGADFSSTSFNKDVDFTNVEFKKSANFRSARFSSEANFRNAKFHNQADFWWTKFHNQVDFSNCVTDSTRFDFRYTTFPDLIDFSDNTFIFHGVDFTLADFFQSKFYTDSARRRHYINFYNSDISKIKIDYQRFRLCFYSSGSYNYNISGYNRYSALPNFKFASNESLIYDKTVYSLKDKSLVLKLLKISEVRNYLNQIFPSAELTDTVINTFLMHCIKKKGFPYVLPKDQIISIYEKVLKNFDVNGQKVSYETLDIEYRDFKNGWFILPYYWNAYGYHKEWVFRWTAFYLLIFTFITSFYIHQLNKKIAQDGVYYISNIPQVQPSKTVRSWLRRLWFAFMYTSTIFFLFGLKIDNLNFKKVSIVYIIVVYSTGLLCLGYIANFVLQK